MELGTEIKVDSRTGRWETIGTNGAEFTKVRPSDIIFNHKQSAELLKNGHINSRGKAYAGGKDNIFSPLSNEEINKYNMLSSVENLAEKLDFGNQKLVNLDKVVTSISNNTNTVNNNPIITVNNPVFECTGVTSEDVMHEIEQSFSGIFVKAYQQSMKK